MLPAEEGTVKDFDYYAGLPYHAVWEYVGTPDGDWYWQVRLREIPAVVGMGSGEDEALAELRERFGEYVRFRIDEGLDIPEPGGSPSPHVAGAGVPQAPLRRAADDGPGSDGRPS